MALRTFGDVAGEIRRYGLKQSDVAKAMGLTGPALSNVLADRTGRPSKDWLTKFVDARDSLNGVPADR